MSAVALIGVTGGRWTYGHRRVDHEILRVSYDTVTVCAPLVSLALWVSGEGWIWNVLLPGLAWRSFLAIHAMPPAVALWRNSGTV